MDPFLTLLVAAGVLLVLALLYRRRAGFGAGETVSHDNLTLRSERYGLIGRPDRIVRRGKTFIPEDKKPGARVYDSYRLQMGVYLILVEEHYGVRPKHGVIVLGDGRRETINNTNKLRTRVLEIADRIREARLDLDRPQPGSSNPAQCRACGQRANCTQRLA
jgi:CRISPR-associated exonuclease Cas4